jgi:hypothetical protein
LLIVIRGQSRPPKRRGQLRDINEAGFQPTQKVEINEKVFAGFYYHRLALATLWGFDFLPVFLI